MTVELHARIDHLVVAASTLDEGVAWCEATLGVTPGPGGTHVLFGTHNRLLRLASEEHPQAYLEIIAIDPQATPTRQAPLRRWFDLDDPAIQDQLTRQGPQLLHWVASVPDIDAACRAWRDLGIDPGPVIEASRETPQGLLRWRITVRDDGRRLFGGALPTLIQWGGTHPSQAMTEPSLWLRKLELRHPQAHGLEEALTMIGVHGITIVEGLAGLHAQLANGSDQPIHLTHREPS